MSARTRYLAKKGKANEKRWGKKVALNKDNKLVEVKEEPKPVVESKPEPEVEIKPEEPEED